MGKKELLVIVLVVVVSRYLLLEFQPFSSSEEGDGVDKEKEMEKECLALLKKGETFRDLAYSKVRNGNENKQKQKQKQNKTKQNKTKT